MIKVFEAPRKYVQGVGVMAEAGKWIAPLGKTALVVWGPRVKQQVGETLTASLAAAGVVPISYECGGNCTRVADRGRRGSRPRAEQAEVVLGVGGGRSIDMAKAIAWETCHEGRLDPHRCLQRCPHERRNGVLHRRGRDGRLGASGRTTPTWSSWTRRSWSMRRSNGWSPAWATRSQRGSRPKPRTRAGERPSPAASRLSRRSSWPSCATTC